MRDSAKEIIEYANYIRENVEPLPDPANNCIVIGRWSKASHNNTIVIGEFAESTEDNQLVIKFADVDIKVKLSEDEMLNLQNKIKSVEWTKK